jgi:cell wall-associated NlpC family hydrolase
MHYGIAFQSVIPVRTSAAHEAEQSTQLLFGEMYSVQEEREDWMRITTVFDQYSGWIHRKQHHPLTTAEADKLLKSQKSVAAELVQTISNNDRSFPILMGSTLYDFDGMNFRIGKEKFVYAGQAVNEESGLLHGEHIRRFAMKFLHAPYLWGGRNPFGIDCSGFSQIVFKLYGITLPRDAYQQADMGKTLHFIHEAREGDLAFFDNEDGKITHVGILLGNDQIIHASGCVRVDIIDHYGIFNREVKKYTHKLRILKRVV